MLEALRGFLFVNKEASWLAELSLCASAWVILRFGVGERPRWYRVLGEFLLLLAAMSASFLCCVALLFPR